MSILHVGNTCNSVIKISELLFITNYNLDNNSVIKT